MNIEIPPFAYTSLKRNQVHAVVHLILPRLCFTRYDAVIGQLNIHVKQVACGLLRRETGITAAKNSVPSDEYSQCSSDVKRTSSMHILK